MSNGANQNNGSKSASGSKSAVNGGSSGSGSSALGYSKSGSSPPEEGMMGEADGSGNFDMREVTGKGEKNLTFTILNKVLNEEIEDYQGAIEDISSREIEKINREEIPEEYKEHIKDYFNRIKE